MILNNEQHIQGIYKYQEDIKFEKGDFVAYNGVLYYCNAPDGIKGELPSESSSYITYPGNQITSSSEYYEYLENREQGADKFISAISFCEILEDMYFGFDDNGIIGDYIFYNPSGTIEYSVRGLRESLETSENILERVLKERNLNNGFLKISGSLVNDVFMLPSESINSVVLLKQHTFCDRDENLYRIQELIDPLNNLIYYRLGSGESFDNITSWRNLVGNLDINARFQMIEDYYRSKSGELEDLYRRIQGKYCYREVENLISGDTITITAGSSNGDIKSIESFDKDCYLDILIKTEILGENTVYKNQSITINTKDIYDSGSENYELPNGTILEAIYNSNGSITLSVLGSSIKNIYYRDFTLGHIHRWVLIETITPPTATSNGLGIYKCMDCDETKTDIIPMLGEIHTTVYISPTTSGKVNNKPSGTTFTIRNNQIPYRFTATPSQHYTFNRFEKNGSVVSTNPIFDYTPVYDNEVIYAYFTPAPTYTITLEVSPEGYGTVVGGGSYYYGDDVTINAIPNPGYEFSRWSDGNTNQRRTITVSGDATYTAEFEEITTATLRVIGDPSISSLIVDGEFESFPFEVDFEIGTSVTLKTERVGSGSTTIFDGWYNGDTLVSQNQIYTFDVSSTITLEARWIKYITIRVIQTGSMGGSISVSSDGQTITPDIRGYYNCPRYSSINIGITGTSSSMFIKWERNGSRIGEYDKETIVIPRIDETYENSQFVATLGNSLVGFSINLESGQTAIINDSDRYDETTSLQFPRGRRIKLFAEDYESSGIRYTCNNWSIYTTDEHYEPDLDNGDVYEIPILSSSTGFIATPNYEQLQ